MLSKDKVKLAIAPINWSNDEFPELCGHHTFEQCIKQTALSGYSGSEIGNMFPKDINKIKEVLDHRGVQICNSWFPTYFTTKSKEITVELFIEQRDFLNKLGAKVIGCSEQGLSIHDQNISVFENKPVFTEEDWKKVADGMNYLGALAKEVGMKVAVHHHMGTGVETVADIEHLMSITDDNVYLLLDTGHIVFSESDKKASYKLLKKYIHRIAHIHLKDVRMDVVKEVKKKHLSFLDSVKLGVFTVPGDGCIDFEPIFKLLEEEAYEGWLVVEAEQDPDIANPFEYALLARSYINTKTGL